jgi:hypothetical protein
MFNFSPFFLNFISASLLFLVPLICAFRAPPHPNDKKAKITAMGSFARIGRLERRLPGC